MSLVGTPPAIGTLKSSQTSGTPVFASARNTTRVESGLISTPGTSVEVATSPSGARSWLSFTGAPPPIGTLQSSKTSFVERSPQKTTRAESGLMRKPCTIPPATIGALSFTGAELPSLGAL